MITMKYGTTGQRVLFLDERGTYDLIDSFLNRMKPKDILIVGGASGWDNLVATEAMERSLKIWLYLPFAAFHASEKLLDYAEVVKTSNIAKGKYHIANFFIRNKWIVTDSNELYAYWNGVEKGGTWHTVKYAREKNRKIVILN